MSPILVRPVREQFEHDRIIRVLQAKYKRKYEVAINPGAEQNASVGIGDLLMYPDLLLFSPERSRKLLGTVEVETTESINTLEAMAEWGPFSRLRSPFFLYVPANSIDTVRRLCTEYHIAAAEIWTYHTGIDQVRFTMVYRSPDAPRVVEPRVKAEKPAAATPKVDKPKVEAKAAEKPKAAKPKAAPSKALKTTAAKPKAVKPKAAKSKPARPKAAKPKTAKPKAAKPKAAKPKNVAAKKRR